MRHYSFPSIEQFRTARRSVQYKAQFVGLDDLGEPIMNRNAILPKIKYKGTVKLHGTNSAIVFSNGSFYCQSRERIIQPGNDNAGFASFVHSCKDLDILKSNFGDNVVVYGEWAGKGIQKGVAIAQLEKAMFIFAAQKISENGEKEEWIDIKDWKLPCNFYNILDYDTFDIEINFENPEYDINKINEWVLEVENNCPVGRSFGIDGVGEGIVFKPIDSNYNNSRYWFKAKGDKHSNSKVKKLATIDIAKFESTQSFVNFALEEGRMEQGFNWLKENGKEQSEKSTGDFIRWIFNDVQKECLEEAKESGIEEKDLGKILSTPAKRWFFNRINKL